MSYGTERRLGPAAAISPAMSGASILAIACALGSFFVGAGWGILLAIVAMIAGLIGLVVSLSPQVRGGVTSIVAILAGLIGIVTAIVRLAIGALT